MRCLNVEDVTRVSGETRNPKSEIRNPKILLGISLLLILLVPMVAIPHTLGRDFSAATSLGKVSYDQDFLIKNDHPRVNPLVVMFGQSRAERLALNMLKSFLPQLIVINYDPSYTSLIVESDVDVIIWVGHSSDAGITWNQARIISWKDMATLLSRTRVSRHVILACDSLTLLKLESSALQGKDIVAFEGLLDAEFAGLYAAYLLARQGLLPSRDLTVLRDLVHRRVDVLYRNPEVIIPLAQKDDTPGSDFDFSPDQYGLTYSVEKVTGTGGYYYNLIITTWFIADQAFIDYFDKHKKIAYIHEIEIREAGGTTEHIFGYWNYELISKDIPDSEAGADRPECWPFFCPDPADDPEYEWKINSPENLEVGRNYTLKFRYYTEMNPAEGDYTYSLWLTAEVDADNYPYGLLYYYLIHDYDLLMKTDPFTVHVVSSSGGGGGGSGDLRYVIE